MAPYLRGTRYVLLSSPDEIKYLLRDEFTTDLPAGSVNGSLCDTGQSRVVTDTSECMSIADRVLSLTGTPTAGTCSLSEIAVSRQAGVLMAFSVYMVENDSPQIDIGFFSQADSLEHSHLKSGLIFWSDGVIYHYSNNSNVGNWVHSTRYDIIIELKATGDITYIKGGAWTDWTNLYDGGTDTTVTLYPGVSFYQSNYSIVSDGIRIPQNLYVSVSDSIKNTISVIPTSRSLSSPLGANDHLAISNAVGLLPATGGTVLLNTGTYIMTGGAAVRKSNSSIVGNGITSIVKRSAGYTGGLLGNPHHAVITNFTLKDFAIDGNKANATATSGDITFAGDTGFAITNLILDNIQAHDCYNGILLTYLTSPTVKNCVLADFGISALSVQGVIAFQVCTSFLAQNNIISGFYSSAYGAMDFSGCSNGIIELNNVQDCIGGAAAIEVESNSHDVIVRNNITANNSAAGYAAAACAGTQADYVTFSGNTSTNDNIGIQLIGTSGTQIIRHLILTDNIIINPITTGISCYFTQYVTIEDNDLSTQVGTNNGIYIDQSDTVEILGGVIDGFAIGINVQANSTNISLGSVVKPITIQNCTIGIDNYTGTPLDTSNVIFINCGTNVVNH